MTPASDASLARVLDKYDNDLLPAWLGEQIASVGAGRVSEAELKRQSRELLAALKPAIQGGNLTDITTAEWSGVRDILTDLSRSRAARGATPSETATFIFSLRDPLLERMEKEQGATAAQRAVSKMLDKLGLFTVEAFQKSREEIITRQQQEMLELSTPVVKLYDQILALPLIGTLDSARTQVVMENLLQRIVESGAEIAIIDITGVPTVDTLVAQHLLKAVAAARLMGADCIISGIRPQIAQTIVHLGVELTDVATKATMAGAFALALERLGLTVKRAPSPAKNGKRASAEREDSSEEN